MRHRVRAGVLRSSKLLSPFFYGSPLAVPYFPKLVYVYSNIHSGFPPRGKKTPLVLYENWKDFSFGKHYLGFYLQCGPCFVSTSLHPQHLPPLAMEDSKLQRLHDTLKKLAPKGNHVSTIRLPF